GSDSSRALFSQAGLLQSVLMIAGPAMTSANFIPLFHLGLFAEELLFLIGCWMLSRRHFSPTATFFVSVAAVGSAFSLDNAWLNVRTIFALPLLLALLHGAI